MNLLAQNIIPLVYVFDENCLKGIFVIDVKLL